MLHVHIKYLYNLGVLENMDNVQVFFFFTFMENIKYLPRIWKSFFLNLIILKNEVSGRNLFINI